ncbi:MAG TPA: hypothetical protein VGL34_19590 [Steroidobacteraceae bacterium]|jgi:hypothetical protein
MQILVTLLSIMGLAALIFYGLLALIRQTLDDGPYAAPVPPIADSPPRKTGDESSSRMSSPSR